MWSQHSFMIRLSGIHRGEAPDIIPKRNFNFNNFSIYASVNINGLIRFTQACWCLVSVNFTHGNKPKQYSIILYFMKLASVAVGLLAISALNYLFFNNFSRVKCKKKKS